MNVGQKKVIMPGMGNQTSLRRYCLTILWAERCEACLCIGCIVFIDTSVRRIVPRIDLIEKGQSRC